MEIARRISRRCHRRIRYLELNSYHPILRSSSDHPPCSTSVGPAQSTVGVVQRIDGGWRVRSTVLFHVDILRMLGGNLRVVTTSVSAPWSYARAWCYRRPWVEVVLLAAAFDPDGPQEPAGWIKQSVPIRRGVRMAAEVCPSGACRVHSRMSGLRHRDTDLMASRSRKVGMVFIGGRGAVSLSVRSALSIQVWCYPWQRLPAPTSLTISTVTPRTCGEAGSPSSQADHYHRCGVEGAVGGDQGLGQRERVRGVRAWSDPGQRP